MKLKDAVRTLLFKEKSQPDKHQLYTRWGQALDSEEVLAEYPRPQLRRQDYTILNGYWNYAITRKETWPEQFEGKILVPFSPESVLSGVNRQLRPDEFLWYEKRLCFSQENPGKRCILHFGAVDQSCEVYLNDFLVARHNGGYLPFSVDITREIQKNDNRLIVKVTDTSNTSYHSRGKQRLTNGGMWYTAQSGIWQTVWYEWVPYRYITGLKITPDVAKGEVQLRLDMNMAKPEAEQDTKIQLTVLEAGRLRQSISTDQHHIVIKLEDYIYWSPENPFLYDFDNHGRRGQG